MLQEAKLHDLRTIHTLSNRMFGKYSPEIAQERALLVNPNGIGYMSRSDGIHGILLGKSTGNGKRRWARLSLLAVDPAWRYDEDGNRVSHLLINTFISWCISNQLGVIRLLVREDNKPALSLYDSFGFKEYGREAKAFLEKSGIKMQLHL